MQYREEFPQLDLDNHHDGFEHMMETPDESNDNDSSVTYDDKAAIAQLQKELSEANQGARCP